MDAKIAQILAIRDPKSQQAEFDTIISKAVKEGASADIQTIANMVLSDSVHQQVAKSVLCQIANAIKTMSDEVFFELACSLVTAIKQSSSPYDEADFILRDALFAYYVKTEQCSDAAQILSAVNTESTVRVFSNDEKADIFVKCAEAALEDDEAIDAEVYLTKASQVINSVSDLTIVLRYRVTNARVLDANRKFVDAAIRYYELSNTTTANIVPEDLLELLGKAITCAILGKAGQQRSRVLGLLFKDSRLCDLDQLPKYSSHSLVLQKVFRDQILKKDDLDLLEASLLPHQQATNSEGFSLLQKAVMEHNMLATSKIYDNIRFSELGNILNLDPRRAEKIAAVMITEGRLRGIIDHTDGLLEFTEGNDTLGDLSEAIGETCEEVIEFVQIAQELSAVME